MTSRSDVYPDQRPATRAGCADMPRPCPFMSCKHHLVTLQAPRQRVANDKSDARDDETLGEILSGKPTCSLDVAAETAIDKQKSLAEVGDLMGITRERTRQIEMLEAAPKLKRRLGDFGRELTVQRGYKHTTGIKPKPMRGPKNAYPASAKLAALTILDAMGSGTKGVLAAMDHVESETGRRPSRHSLFAWKRAASVRT